MIDLIQSESLIAASLSVVATLGAVLIRHWLTGKVNLISFSPDSTFFEIGVEDVEHPILQVRSGQVMIQNLGRKAAEDVQIIAGARGIPAGYNIVPAVEHSSALTSKGQWLLEIPFIAPKELITIQILNGPNIESIRCRGGAASFVPVIHQRLYPKWLTNLVGVLMTFGIFSLFYFAVTFMI